MDTAYAKVRLMKQRSTTPVSSYSFAAKAATVACAVLMAIAMPIQLGHTVYANYDSQIRAAQEEAKRNQGQAELFATMANSYQEELAQLEAQAQTLQNQINESQAQHDKLEGEIKTNEGRIKVNSSALGDTVVDLHVDSQVSPLEMVASSKNISDIVDKQTQQAEVQNKLNDTIEEIKKLQDKLAKQQEKVKAVLRDQNSQRQQLAAKEAEKAKLVAETRGEEGAYRQRAEANNQRVSQLQAAQAEENRRAVEAAMAAAASARGGGGGWQGGIPAGSPGGGGYPGAWANAPINSYVDSWGLYSRQCVSYAAWKVASTGRYVPHFQGMGNANQWPSTVARHGIQSGSTPRAGSVAMMPIGYYGHVMYVESVNADGTITVSDYNLEWDGLYRQYTRSAGGLTYIYF